MNERKAEYIRQYGAARYARLKANNLCVVCGKVPPIPGRVHCEACAEENRRKGEFTRRPRRARGVCLYCGKEKVNEGHSICPPCMERQRNLMAARRIQKSEERSAVNG